MTSRLGNSLPLVFTRLPPGPLQRPVRGSSARSDGTGASLTLRLRRARHWNRVNRRRVVAPTARPRRPRSALVCVANRVAILHVRISVHVAWSHARWKCRACSGAGGRLLAALGSWGTLDGDSGVGNCVGGDRRIAIPIGPPARSLLGADATPWRLRDSTVRGRRPARNERH